MEVATSAVLTKQDKASQTIQLLRVIVLSFGSTAVSKLLRIMKLCKLLPTGSLTLIKMIFQMVSQVAVLLV
jgi:hypothetical protein